MKYIKKILSILSIGTILLTSGCGNDDKSYTGNLTAPSQPNTSNQPIMPANLKKSFGADPNKIDTDGDGLRDDFEIMYGSPFLKPDSKDSNNNGITDDQEDTDGDKLKNIDEQKYQTLPRIPDTDSDGLTDYYEIYVYKTNPLVVDTDNDGVIDGREIQNKTNPLEKDADKTIVSSKSFQIINTDTGNEEKISVSTHGIGDLSNNIIISSGSDAKVEGQIGRSIDISLPDTINKSMLTSATITLSIDSKNTIFNNTQDIAVFTINPQTGGYEELPTTIDLFNSTISAQTTHFTEFFIASKSIFYSSLKKIPQTCDAVDDPKAKPTDVVLVIDSSGSMISNDPNNLRITAAKSFINKMKAIDRSAVVDFDSYAKITSNLTTNKTDLINGLNSIDASGGTNIGYGVSTAYEILKNNSSTERNRVIILLTDGEGSYSTSLTTQLSKEGIRVFTIGLTGAVDENLLKRIAKETNGGYKQINSADGLNNIFTEFASVFGETGVDSDQDGLTDCQEIQGIYLTNLKKIVHSDPNQFDTDGDGLSDAFEMGNIVSKRHILHNSPEYTAWVATGISDPQEKDTDFDQIDDFDEYDYGLIAYAKDTDQDGLTDYDEIYIKDSDPLEQNTDGDQFKLDSQDEDPTVYDFTLDEFHENFTAGAICGAATNYCQNITSVIGWSSYPLNFISSGTIQPIHIKYNDAMADTIPYVLGDIASGTVVLGDIRNVLANISNGKLGDAAFDGIGFIPYLGDGSKFAVTINKFIKKNPSKAKELVTLSKKHLPEEVSKAVDDIVNAINNTLKSDIWKNYNPFVRGKELEKLVVTKYSKDFKGDALLGNFPTIDVWDVKTGKAISIKSIDTTKVSYSTSEKFKSKINQYIKQLEGFPPKNGVKGTSATTGNQIKINPSEVTSRELALVIPHELNDDFKKVIDEISSEKGIVIKTFIE